MISAPLPANEAARLAALTNLGLLDTLPQGTFDDITALASAICGTPIALISLVDAERQWFKSRVGIDAPQTARDVAFCAHAILEPEQVMVVEDATLDARFHDNPLVSQAPDIRFYAGAPIVTRDGFALGTVCVMDREARTLSAAQIDGLRSLSRLVVSLIEHDKRQREEALLASEEMRQRNAFLVAVTTASLDMNAFIDHQHIYRYANHAYLDFFGLAREAVEGKPVAQVLGKEFFEDTVKPRLDAALAGESGHFEGGLAHGTDYPVHVDVTYLPARDAAGVIIGAVVRLHNVQKLKERELLLRSSLTELEHKTLEQQRFIHIVSHDLREPVNTIINFSTHLAEHYAQALPPEARRYLDFVQGGGTRMKQLLDDLVAYVQLEKDMADLRPVDLNATMNLVSADLADVMARTGGSVDWDGMPRVHGDGTLLRVLLQNLVANGIKFVAPEIVPQVTLAALAGDGFIEIQVRDNGIGVPEEQREKIFDMFQRLHLRKQYEGTGLGLSICRRIAEMHGGRISVTAAAGGGSCFSVFLPDSPRQLEKT